MKTRRSRARISLAIIAVFAIVTVFVVRLVDIQLVRAEELNAESSDKRAQTLITYGTRGSIVDANGAILAETVERFDVTASPKNALGRDELAAELAEIAAITGQDPAALMAVLAEQPEADWARLTKGVTLEVFQAVRDLDIPWVYFEPRPERIYPNGAIAGNLVGFMNTDGPGAGLEASEDECLASTNGKITYERGEDDVQLPGSAITEVEREDGGTLQLTIDRDLQFYIQQRLAQAGQSLGATWATAVVMRVEDGHLMAVADWPTIDPNNVDDAPRDALGSRAFSTPYEPGSTMKAITAASVIDAGVATPTSGVVAPYRLPLSDGTYIKDAFYHDDQRLTLTGALIQSSNTAVSQFSLLLPAEQRRDYLLGFGYNDYTEVGFTGESSGTVLPTSDWDERTNLTVQFGQAMTATSVQMASAYQTIGNGGVRMPVTLVEGCRQPDGTMTDVPSAEGERVISESAADQTVQMLEMVASYSAASDDLQVMGYRVAAKSGTAEVAENGEYGNKNVISFAGLVPAEDPKYVVVVTAGIPYTMYSGKIATTFTDIAAQVLTTYRIPPATEPRVDLPATW